MSGKNIFDLDEVACSLCGHPGPFFPFYPGASLRETRCPKCRSSRRSRDLVRALLLECEKEPSRPLSQSLKELSPLHIHEFQAQGPLHDQLRSLPYYTCSEYYPGLPSGSYEGRGVLCQDASCLSFADNSFDLMISQDVMEHMADPWRGFAEINRVLRPGGKYIFTIPLHEGRRTRQRARLDATGMPEHLLLPVHHKDPLNPEGALVFWDFGVDLASRLCQQGLCLRLVAHVRFYQPWETCDICNAASHEMYCNAWTQKLHAAFFLYNSAVFVAEKVV